MPQSPQHHPLVQSTRTKYFTRTLAQNTTVDKNSIFIHLQVWSMDKMSPVSQRINERLQSNYLFMAVDVFQAYGQSVCCLTTASVLLFCYSLHILLGPCSVLFQFPYYKFQSDLFKYKA
jgi:hypothetical protein